MTVCPNFRHSGCILTKLMKRTAFFNVVLNSFISKNYNVGFLHRLEFGGELDRHLFSSTKISERGSAKPWLNVDSHFLISSKK